MIVRRVKPLEYRRIRQLCALAFEYPCRDSGKTPQEIYDSMLSDPVEREALEITAQWAAFLDDDATMMSTLSAITFDAMFDGHIVPMVGIGGVASFPQYRNQGGIRGCFNAALSHMYEQGAVLSYLYPFSTAYYRRFGYELGCDRVRWKLRLAGLPRFASECRCQQHEPDNDLSQSIREIDIAWQRRYNLMVIPGAPHQRWMKADPFESGEYTYVCFSREGTPKGYLSYRLRVEGTERLLDVSRIAFTDAQGLEGLLSLLMSTAADHSHAVFFLPCDVDLCALLPEWSLGVVSREIFSYGMVRVVNAVKALSLARTRGEGSLVLELTDEQIAYNNGRFLVRFGQGGVQEVCRTQDAPDLSMGIAAFSRMLCGRCALDAYPALPDVRRLSSKDASGLFYPKPLYISTYF